MSKKAIVDPKRVIDQILTKKQRIYLLRKDKGPLHKENPLIIKGFFI